MLSDTPSFAAAPRGAPPRLDSVARQAALKTLRLARLAELVEQVTLSARWWAQALDDALARAGFERRDRCESDPCHQGLARWRGTCERGELWLEVQARCWREYGQSAEVCGLALELSTPARPGALTTGPGHAAMRCLGVALLHRGALDAPLDAHALQESLLHLEPEQVLAWVAQHRNG